MAGEQPPKIDLVCIGRCTLSDGKNGISFLEMEGGKPTDRQRHFNRRKALTRCWAGGIYRFEQPHEGAIAMEWEYVGMLDDPAQVARWQADDQIETDWRAQKKLQASDRKVKAMDRLTLGELASHFAELRPNHRRAFELMVLDRLHGGGR